jgi:hypothetical protein
MTKSTRPAARTVTIQETIVRGRHRAIGLGEPRSAAGRRTLAAPAARLVMLQTTWL